ncbi:hypothetical protein Cni_G19402 [Canna indica]|uniref:Uncharacterized protein n=1 Tax=Canna indica TaxID=4628 RepID=A0AAQ3KPF6_9LILI|nr:hypothetical protein Cni_G19402 [Canna indica]
MASLETEKGRARVGMPFSRLPGFAIFVLLLILVFAPFSIGDSRLSSRKHPLQVQIELQHGSGMWRRFVAEFPLAKNATTHNITFVLAAHRTYRRDPLNGYQRYPGGWNISNQHYWASVGFTAILLFTIVIAWYVGFGLVLLLMCCCYCCCRRQKRSYSPVAYALSLIVLILLTVVAM